MIDFDFEEGDNLLVRVRENGTSGNIVARFEAECREITGYNTGSPQARLDLPWGEYESTRIRPYEAEFEVIE